MQVLVSCERAKERTSERVRAGSSCQSLGQSDTRRPRSVVTHRVAVVGVSAVCRIAALPAVALDTHVGARGTVRVNDAGAARLRRDVADAAGCGTEGKVRGGAWAADVALAADRVILVPRAAAVVEAADACPGLRVAELSRGVPSAIRVRRASRAGLRELAATAVTLGSAHGRLRVRAVVATQTLHTLVIGGVAVRVVGIREATVGVGRASCLDALALLARGSGLAIRVRIATSTDIDAIWTNRASACVSVSGACGHGRVRG